MPRLILTSYRSSTSGNITKLITLFQSSSKGESLRRFIERGLIPIRKYLEIAVQIADALAAAPQGGIVYRDLKPENIMLARENRVKILDFGLAKLSTRNGNRHTPICQKRQQCKPCPQSLAK